MNSLNLPLRRRTNSLKRLLLLVAILWMSTQLLFAGTPELLFEAGSKAYLEGDYETALERWSQIQTSGYQSGVLFYNIGNVNYKLGNLGESILYWEKAANLIGEDGDLTENLSIARSKLKDKLDEPVRLPVWDWFDRQRAGFSPTLLGVFGILFSFILFALAGIRRWLLRGSGARRGFLVPIWIVLVLLIIDLTFLTLKARDDIVQKEGILLITEAEVLSAPAQGSGKLLFTLHEGTKIRIFRKLENWYEISAGKERQGWIKKGAVGVI